MSLAASPPFHLPQELVDHIIDYLHNDVPTLKAISLVARAWLPTTRLHLFSTLALKARPGRIMTAQPRQQCARLYELVTDNPELARYVRELEIWEGASHSQCPYRSWVLDEPTLPLLLARLSLLESLNFCGNSSIYYQELPESLRGALYTVLALPSLSYFRLHNWMFPSFGDLTSLLSSTVSLKGLALSCTSVGESEEEPDGSEDNTSLDIAESADPESSHASRLDFLTLDFVEFKKFGYWLLNQRCPLSVRSLRELRVSHSQTVTTTSRLLTSIGGSLEHLHLKPGPWDVHSFDLGLNPCLRTLRLTLEDPSQAIPWVTTLFSTFTDYNSLEHIGLEFYADLKKMEGWNEVDAVLTRHELDSLKKVDIGVFAHPTNQEFAKVKQELKGLTAKGILRIYQLGIRSRKSNSEFTPMISRYHG